MANHNAAQKSIRQTTKRTVSNRQRMSRIRTYIRYVEESVAAGNKSEAQERLQRMQSEIMRGVRRNLFKLNTASRKISRMNARVKALLKDFPVGGGPLLDNFASQWQQIEPGFSRILWITCELGSFIFRDDQHVCTRRTSTAGQW